MSEALNRYGSRNGYGDKPPAPKWPKNAKVALNFSIHYQDEPVQDDSAVTESVYEYGGRAGFWRYHRLFHSKKIPITFVAAGTALESNPALCFALRDAVNMLTPGIAHWEVATQGYQITNTSTGNDADSKREQLEKGIQAQEKLVGRRPVGHYSGSLDAETRNQIVEMHSFKYDSNSYADDLPYWTLDYCNRPHLIIPYTLTESDDKFTVDEQFFKHLKETLRYLIMEGRAGQPKMMTVALHCHLARPGRAAAVADFIDYVKSYSREVWCCTREEIADFWISNHSPRGAGSPVKVRADGTIDRTVSGDGSAVSEDFSSKVGSGVMDIKDLDISNGSSELKKDDDDKASTDDVEGDVI